MPCFQTHLMHSARPQQKSFASHTDPIDHPESRPVLSDASCRVAAIKALKNTLHGQPKDGSDACARNGSLRSVLPDRPLH